MAPRALAMAASLVVCLSSNAAVGETDEVSAEELRIFASTRICYAKLGKAAAAAIIAKERRASRYGGVVDMNVLHAQQTRMVVFDDIMREAKRDLTTYKMRPMSCKDPLVARSVACVDEQIDVEDDDPRDTDHLSDECTKAALRRRDAERTLDSMIGP